MNVEHKSREDNFRKLGELTKRLSKPRGGFRSLGEELSGHNAAMITVGVKVSTTPKRDPGRERSN
jgi:hypothetical protein